MPPHEPDFVVMPKTTAEVQEIVKLANKEKVPLVPKGAGLGIDWSGHTSARRHCAGYEADG